MRITRASILPGLKGGFALPFPGPRAEAEPLALMSFADAGDMKFGDPASAANRGRYLFEAGIGLSNLRSLELVHSRAVVFPARDDDRDVGAWEYVVHGLAVTAGIDVPPARLVRLNNDFHTFCIQRFDRVKGARRFYASAMTLLRKEHSEGSSYIELAQFLRSNGDGAHSGTDLEQLFRRVAFNVAVGNRDDHLRNHGFVLGANGWKLAPAFDVNPNIDKAEHVLNIDDADSRPSLQTVLSTAPFYGLSADRAKQVVEEVASAVDSWRDAARKAGIAAADVELTTGAFSAHSEYRA